MKGALVKVPVTPFTIAAEQHLVGLFEDVDVLHFSKNIGVPVPRDAVFVGFIDLQFGSVNLLSYLELGTKMPTLFVSGSFPLGGGTFLNSVGENLR